MSGCVCGGGVFPLKKEWQTVRHQSEDPKRRFDSKKQSLESLQSGEQMGCVCVGACAAQFLAPSSALPSGWSTGAIPYHSCGADMGKKSTSQV